MRGLYFLPICLMLSLGMFSCKVTEKKAEVADKEVVSSDEAEIIVQQEPEEITEIKLYRAEATRHFRLLHTKLAVSFDWEKQYLFGVATLVLEPYFYDQSQLILDAKGLDIHEVALVVGEKTESLSYEYDGSKLDIDLGETYKKGQKIHVRIDYTSKPNEGDFADNPGSDQKGLYFINPTGETPGKPRQIWSQGETETNSRWFPTLDAPNQKSTQETYITVDDQFKTLSNGLLVYSKSNADGTRTDYWKMDKPHAPYLFMIAVGDFVVTEDDYKGMKVDYYVEPEYAKYARDIFGNTPEMIAYFSEILDYPYPWPKYSQIVVRDYITGAMENTTASVFMEDLNVNSRELLDYNWDDIIAHELFHQWFGDLVTCESWANLPLNESFATYGEYLWTNHKYGKDEGEYKLYEELDSYLAESEIKKEDLIRFYYDDSEEMFDSHSYAKGGLILNLLKNYVGEEAFFASLNYYLKANAFNKTEIHDLRRAFEEVTGEDLNWFFDQWFLASGHPELRVEEEYDSLSDSYVVKVWQDQDFNLYPVFKLQMTLDMWNKGEKEEYLIEIDRPYQEFYFEGVQRPDLVLVDSEFDLVGEIDHRKTAEQYLFQYEHYPHNVRARIAALEYFTDNPNQILSGEVLEEGLRDQFWVIRDEVLPYFEKDSSGLFSKNESIIVEMALCDPKSLVKAAAISVLESQGGSRYNQIYKSGLSDSSYSVVGQALYAYLQSGNSDADSVASCFIHDSNFNITSSLADYFIRKNDYDKYDWFLEQLQQNSGEELWYFIKIFSIYIFNAPEAVLQPGIKELESIALSHYQFYNRFAAYQGLEMLSDREGVPEMLNTIKEKEKDPRIKSYLE